MAKWVIDPDHTVAGFSIRHLMIANVRGHFSKITGTIHFDYSDVTHSSVQVTIDAASICTGIKKRDEHLRSPDFFDVDKYPQITFKSTKVEITGSNRCKVNGDLTIHMITRSVTLEAEYFGPIKSPFGATSMGFAATTMINREDYGMAWNEHMESGGFMVGKDVQITLEAEADLTAD
ncbi:MAG: YceI family protein [Nitrospirota bacterium]